MSAPRQEYIPLTTLILDPDGVPWTPEPHRRTWFVSDGQSPYQGPPGPSEDDMGIDVSSLGEWRWWSYVAARLGGGDKARERALACRLQFLSGGDS